MKYRKDIDGLRALAVIPVILFHAGFDLFSGGFVGVDVFFVVSGYLITSIILADLENETFSFHNFYKRRVWRIMPALLFVMLTCIPLAWMWLLPGQMKSFSHSFVGVLLFVSNIFFWRETGYFEDAAEEKPMLHTWSLAVEEQYYLVFPLFMFMAWRFGKNKVFWIIVVFAAVSFLFSEWGWRYKPSANFYLAPTRAWELLAGSIAAFLAQKFGVRRNEWLSQLGLAAILYAVFAYDLTTPFPSIYALVPVLGVVLLILFANEETMVAKLLSAKAMVGIGLVSYSAYLWHQPLFAFARIRLLHEPSPMLMMGLSVVSIFLAVASWRYVEQPFRREGGRLRRCISVRFLFIVLLLLSGFGVVGHFTNGFAYRITPDIKRIVENNMDIFKDNVNACWDGLEKNSTVAGGCALGRSDGSHSFALIGDSHAGAIQTSLSDIAKKKGLSGLGLSYLSCPPLSNAKPLTAEKTCSELRKSIFSMDGLRTLPSTVIVSARWANLVEREPYVNNYGVEEMGGPWIWDLGHREETNYKKSMSDEILDSLNAIVESGRRLVIVYPVPEMGWDVPKYLARYLLNGNDLELMSGSVSYDSFLARNKNAISVLDKVGIGLNVVRVYPHEELCSKTLNFCAAHRDGDLLYFDDDHVSNFGARIISQKIISIFGKTRN